MERLKIQPLTEEQISAVTNYFDNGDKGNYTESQIRLWYGRMKGQGVKIDLAEEGIKKLNKRKQESYRRSKEQEINDHLKAYRQEKAWENGIYELMRVKEREDGRTMVIWFMEKFDEQLGKYKWSHAVEIEERQNPDYFQEIAKRFKLVID